VQASRRAFGRFGGEVVFAHGIFVFLGGVEDQPLIRSVAELIGWLNDASRKTDLLSVSLGMMWREIVKGGEGEQPVPSVRLRLPISTTEFAEKKWVSCGWPYLPKGVAPAGPDSEHAMICTLLEEVSSKFAIPVGVPVPPVRSDGWGAGEPRYVVIGGSHAIRLAEAIRESGSAAIVAAKPGWRVSASAVESLLSLASMKIEDVYIYQLFDNSFHMARSEEFVLLPHSKDASGRYHVFGEAVLAPRDTQFDLFRTCLPLLKLSEGKKALILSPLPRYLYERCCADKDHVVGLEENGHRDRMREDAEKSRTFLKDFAWTCGLRHAKTLNMQHGHGRAAWT
jgi:hypothetical protein